MTDNEKKSSLITWIIAAAIGGALVYLYLKNKNPTMTLQQTDSIQTMENSQSPIINLNLEGFDRRFENLEYKINQLQLHNTNPGTYLTMKKEPLVIAKIENKPLEIKKEEVKEMEMDMQQFNSSRGREAIDKGNIFSGKRFGDYYDIHGITTNAVTDDPNDFDSNLYDTYNIYQVLGRKADVIYVSNDATAQVTDTLFVVISHDGGLSYTKEEPIYAKEVKRYNNLYAIKVRSPTQSLAFRISEYEIKKI